MGTLPCSTWAAWRLFNGDKFATHQQPWRRYALLKKTPFPWAQDGQNLISWR